MQRDVLGDRELEHETAALPVLGDVADTGVEHLAGARMRGARWPATCIDAALERRRPVIASISSVWPLPSTPAMPTISPARTAKETPLHLLDPAVVEDVEILDLEQRLARLGRRLLDAEQHLAADHRAGQRLLRRALPRHGLDRLAAPQHGDPVGDLEHLVQLVA